MVFGVILISMVLAIIMRLLDIRVVFAENHLRLTFYESIRVFLILLKNLSNTIGINLKDKNWQDLKKLLILYVFHFRLLLVLLSSLTFEAIRIKGVEGVTVGKKELIDV